MRRIWPRRMALSMTELLGLKGAAGGERKRGERRNEDAGRITHERLAASRAGDRIGDVNRGVQGQEGGRGSERRPGGLRSPRERGAGRRTDQVGGADVFHEMGVE